ncbi:hypothetical protein PVAP13_8NG166302 [Panicum virgatum]|uniref:Uncharacterized protein n=1 Tax=Panicum virgatum TaxID=38727 RepID=A0A8T0P4Z6_PANVG|nr:hypothetical protein PVAP13_8NG166302 [Panicum virgatum]
MAKRIFSRGPSAQLAQPPSLSSLRSISNPRAVSSLQSRCRHLSSPRTNPSLPFQSRRRARVPDAPSTSASHPYKYETCAAPSRFLHAQSSAGTARFPNPSRRAALGADLQATRAAAAVRSPRQDSMPKNTGTTSKTSEGAPPAARCRPPSLLASCSRRRTPAILSRPGPS